METKNERDFLFLNGILFVLFSEVLSISYFHCPNGISILRSMKIKKTLNDPNNCLVKLFKTQSNFMYVDITKTHIQEGKSRISKIMFCKIYFSNMIKFTHKKDNFYQRLIYTINDSNLFILRDQFQDYVRSRQGYIKDPSLFEKIFNNSSPKSKEFVKNTGLNDKKCHKLNCFIQQNIYGVVNHYILRNNISYIKMNIPVVASQISFVSSKTGEVEIDDMIYLKTSSEFSKIKEYYEVPNDKLILGKLNFHKKYRLLRNNFSEKDKETMMRHTLLKKMKNYNKLLIKLEREESYIGKLNNHKIENLKRSIFNYKNDIVALKRVFDDMEIPLHKSMSFRYRRLMIENHCIKKMKLNAREFYIKSSKSKADLKPIPKNGIWNLRNGEIVKPKTVKFAITDLKRLRRAPKKPTYKLNGDDLIKTKRLINKDRAIIKFTSKEKKLIKNLDMTTLTLELRKKNELHFRVYDCMYGIGEAEKWKDQF